MDHDAMIDNILSTYATATPAEREAGMTWYSDAHNMVKSLTDDVWRGAGVVACYSPMTPWKRNVELATDSLTRGVARDDFLPAMVLAAQSILDGSHPLDVLKGDKTRAFCAAIATNGNSDIATIDRHAHDIAMGRVFTDSERKIGKRVFRAMSAAYVDAAFWCEVSVSQMQAITWVAWRNRKGVR